MLQTYSIVKARALSDEELSSINGMNVNYITENYDATGYKVFTPKEKQKYVQMAQYMKPISLYTRRINFDRIKKANSVPDDFHFNTIFKLCEMHVVEFIDSYDVNKLCVSLTTEEIQDKYMDTEYHNLYVAYIEPIAKLDNNNGHKLCSIVGAMDYRWNIGPGYYKVPKDAIPSFPTEVYAAIAKEDEDFLMFHTYELLSLKAINESEE